MVKQPRYLKVNYQRLKHVGLQLGMVCDNPRYNRQVDNYPVPYVEGSNEIGFSFVTTQNAPELGSFMPISLVDGMADRAFLTGIVWDQRK